MPHAVHEHVRVFGFQRPRAPLVDLPVDPFELVAQCLRGHAVSPQQLADVVDLAGAHARQVHVDQGFLDALLAPPVAFDHRGLEQGALEFRHLQLEPAGLGVVPEKLRTLDHGRPWSDDQFASTRLSSSRDMSR